MKKTIALDAMGGDHGPSVVVPAAIEALERWPSLELILVGDEDTIRRHLGDYQNNQLLIHHTTQVVGMNELPSQALRTKKDSSMRVAINLVKDKRAAACVSAGNTGALMATARFVLKTLSIIDRPAIISALPTMKGKTRVLDLGANVNSCADTLFQFAVMGSVLVECCDGIQAPRVGLLNIGTEEIKGSDEIKQAAHLLSHCQSINYIGYVEGDDIFTGNVDVVVCDGFVGNVALKTMEGVARLIAQFFKEAYTKNAYSKFAGIISQPVLTDLKKRMDPQRYNGASFIGLQGTVVKSHGGSTVRGFRQAIYQALLEVEHDVVNQISGRLIEVLELEGKE